MWHGEARLVDDAVTEEQQVEIDRSRPPPRADSLAPEAPLHVEQERQERLRVEACLDLGDGIQKAWLVLMTPRLGLDDRPAPLRRR